jgi:DNA end-binding protein Ku
MARPIWTGVISFGLVSVPVAMYSATSEHEVSFHQFQRDTTDRIRYKRVNERTGKEVDFADIVKGADAGRGRYVMVEPDELDAVAPGRSRSMDVHAFVELAEIDPVYFEKPYFVVPQKGAEKPYALLRAAMERSERVAIARFVMRTKQYLAALRVADNVIVLETLYFDDEIRDTKELNVPSRTKIADRELRIANQLIDSLTVPWKPAKYEDTYRERVLDLIRRKGKGQEIDVERPKDEDAQVLDLFEALQKSLESKGSTKKRTTKRAPSKKKAPAKRRAS